MTQSLTVMFLSEGLRLADTDLDLAICSVVNALHCRNIREHNRQEIISILGDMQKEQRSRWRNGQS